MSADNYNLVKRLGDTWRVWLNLSASCSRDENLARAKPARDFTDGCEAVRWAEAQGYTEYGTEVDDGSESEQDVDPRDARIAALEKALIEALDRWEGYAVGSQSPTYQGPSEEKAARMLARISALRLLSRTGREGE